jgi:O-antigen ligase
MRTNSDHFGIHQSLSFGDWTAFKTDSQARLRALIVWFSVTCAIAFILAEVLLLAIAVCGALVLLQQRRSNSTQTLNDTPHFDMLDRWICAAVMSAFCFKLLSVLWALDPLSSFKRAFNFTHFLVFPLVYAAVKHAKLTASAIDKPVALTCIGLFFAAMGVKVIAPGSSDADRFSAMMGSPAMLSTIMAFFTAWLLVGLTRKSEGNQNRTILVIGFFCAWAVLTATQTRIDMLGALAACSFVLIWRALSSFDRSKTTKMLLAATAVVLCVASLAGFFVKDRFIEGFQQINQLQVGSAERVSLRETPIGSRLEMWHVAQQAIAERPLLGWGAGIRPKHLPQFAHDPAKPQPFRNFHSQALQIVMEVGLIGLSFAVLTVGFLFWVTVIYAWRFGKPEIACLTTCLWIVFATKSVVNTSLFYL